MSVEAHASVPAALPGADVQKAASAGAFGSYLHQGQICMTTGRHIVHESLLDEYTAALATKAGALPVGDPAREEVVLGPLIDRRQLERVHTASSPRASRRGRPSQRAARSSAPATAPPY